MNNHRSAPNKSSYSGTKLLRTAFLLSTAIFFAMIPSARGYGDEGRIVIGNGVVIDGTGNPPVSGRYLEIRGDRIYSIGEEKPGTDGGSYTFIDAKGCTILPGIINAHVHEISDPGVVLGYHISNEISTVDEARGAVVILINRNASFVKIALELGPADYALAGGALPVLPRTLVSAIVKTADINRFPVRAHVTDFPMAVLAADEGVDTIEHLPIPLLSAKDRARILNADDPVRNLFYDALPEYRLFLQRLASEGIALVPTLTSVGRVFCHESATAEDRAALEVYLAAVRIFLEAGGMIAVGNDYPEPGAETGIPLHEMLLLERAGLSPMDIAAPGHLIDLGDHYRILYRGMNQEHDGARPEEVTEVRREIMVADVQKGRFAGLYSPARIVGTLTTKPLQCETVTVHLEMEDGMLYSIIG